MKGGAVDEKKGGQKEAKDFTEDNGEGWKGP